MTLNSESPPLDHPFVQTFAEAWIRPNLEKLMAPLHNEVVLRQPLSKPLVGKKKARSVFSQILYRFPGIHGEVLGGIENDGYLYIDWTMIVPISQRIFRIPVIDRIIFEDSRVKERFAYFDPVPLMIPIATSPSCIWRHLRSISL